MTSWAMSYKGHTILGSTVGDVETIKARMHYADGGFILPTFRTVQGAKRAIGAHARNANLVTPQWGYLRRVTGWSILEARQVALYKVLNRNGDILITESTKQAALREARKAGIYIHKEQ